MQFQSIHFSQDTAVFFLRIFRAVVQFKSLAVLCFSRNGHNKMSPKSIFKENFVLQDPKYKI